MPARTRAQTKLQRDPLSVLKDKTKGTGKYETRSVSKRKKIVSNVLSEIVKKEHPDASKSDLKKLQEKAIKKALQDLDKQEKQAKPPKNSSLGAIVNKDRIDFSDSRKFWRNNANANCVVCNQPINPRDRSIDHDPPWATIRVGLETAMVCKDGVHWEVVLVDTMQEAYDDERNLWPTHKRCNSSKGGPKGNDSVTPQRRGPCLGGCKLPKAT